MSGQAAEKKESVDLRFLLRRLCGLLFQLKNLNVVVDVAAVIVVLLMPSYCLVSLCR